MTFLFTDIEGSTRRWEQLPGRRPEDPNTYGRRMSRRVAWTVAAALTSLLFAVVATSGGVHLWVEPQWDPTPREGVSVDLDPQPVPTEFALPGQNDQTPAELPDWIEAILRVIVAVLVVVAIASAVAGAIALVMAIWRNRPRLRWRRRWAGDADFDVLPDVHADLAAAVVDEAATQRAALNSGTPRNAIVRCWVRLERDVASVGLTRDPADTSVEFTERVLARYSVDPEAIRELAALYREARFSEHPLGESARRSALDALDRLHQALGDAAVEAAAGDRGESAVGVPR